MVLGPDGNVWFVNLESGSLGRIEPDGTLTSFPLDLGHVYEIVAGADGNLWLLGDYDIVLVGVDGQIVTFDADGEPIPDTYELPSTFSGRLVAGSDGRMWFSFGSEDAVGALTVSDDREARSIEVFTAPDLRSPQALAADPAGAVWASSGYNPARVARIGTDGSMTTHATGTSSGATALQVGSDGRIWFVDEFAVPQSQIGWLDPDDLPPPFVDVGMGNPFCQEIGWMADEGISSGYADRTYRSTAGVSRAAMSAFLHRLAGSPAVEAPGVPTFPDVGTSHPFYDEVEWLAQRGIATGYEDGAFRPSATISRGAMAAFLHRLAGAPEVGAPEVPSFPDVGMSHRFFAEVEWMAAEAISTGYADGSFRVAAPVTRGAMSAFLRRFDAIGP
jgi:hypothetical protein